MGDPVLNEASHIVITCVDLDGIALETASRLTKLRQLSLSKICSQPHKPCKSHSQIEYAKKVFKERANPIFGFSEDDIRNSYTRQIDKLYKVHNPVKRQSVPALVQQYRGREEHLLQKVRAKYCAPKR